MVYQMALREGECFLVRRVAGRGIDKNIGGSRARGEDRCPTRRVADRGSDGFYPDPRDLEIKRLRQRVQDLEEIKRLRQRVRDLELQREMRKAETESSTVVWDEGGDKEQHPLGRHPPWFFEHIYQERLTVDEPALSTIVWDESDANSDTVVWDESDHEEEATNECLKVHEGCSSNESMGLNMKSLAKEMPDCAMLSPVIMHWKYGDDAILKFGSVESVDGSSHTLAKVGTGAPKVTPSFMPKASIVVPSFKPGETRFLLKQDFTKDPIMVGIQNGIDLSGKKMLVNCDKDAIWDHYFPIYDLKIDEDENCGDTRGNQRFNFSTLLPPMCKSHEAELKVHGAPFDPGGTGLESGETIREVGLFRRVVITVNRNRVDVPFDPGWLCFEDKTRGRVFFRRGGV